MSGLEQLGCESKPKPCRATKQLILAADDAPEVRARIAVYAPPAYFLRVIRWARCSVEVCIQGDSSRARWSIRPIVGNWKTCMSSRGLGAQLESQIRDQPRADRKGLFRELARLPDVARWKAPGKPLQEWDGHEVVVSVPRRTAIPRMVDGPFLARLLANLHALCAQMTNGR